MEVTVNIPFSELLTVLDRLTPAQRATLQTKLSDRKNVESSKEKLRALLLTGPKLTDKQLQSIQQTRKEINQWRKRS